MADQSPADLAFALTQATRTPRSSPDPRPHPEAIAISQAATMEARRLENVALQRERDTADGAREAALDLAEQYARQAGVDTSRDDVLRYTVQYWEQRTAFEKTWQALEGQRWETLSLARDLGQVVDGRLVFRGGAVELAGVLAKELTAINSAQGGRKRSVGMFARPEAEQGSLLGTAETQAAGELQDYHDHKDEEED